MQTENQKQWYLRNREKILQQRRAYQQANTEEIALYKKEHYKKNNELYKKRASANRKKRQSVDPQAFREKEAARIDEWRKRNRHIEAWRSVLRNCLTRIGKPKTDKTRKMLGYSATQLKLHIESLWLVGMSWENYGEWHIDHIEAVSTFPPGTPAAVINRLSNLQPMWATSRVIDGVFYEGNLNKGASK